MNSFISQSKIICLKYTYVSSSDFLQDYFCASFCGTMPQIRFALSRGFAVSGLSFGPLPGVALADSLAPGYFRPPFQGFQFAASPTVDILSATVPRTPADPSKHWTRGRAQVPFSFLESPYVNTETFLCARF